MMDKEISEYAKEQGYTKKDLTKNKCKCGFYVYKEKGELSKEFPFYCANCDENMFNIEVEEESKAYQYLYNFCIDYCKDEEEREEFFKNLNEYLDEEIEKEKDCNQ